MKAQRKMQREKRRNKRRTTGKGGTSFPHSIHQFMIQCQSLRYHSLTCRKISTTSLTACACFSFPNVLRMRNHVGFSQLVSMRRYHHSLLYIDVVARIKTRESNRHRYENWELYFLHFLLDGRSYSWRCTHVTEHLPNSVLWIPSTSLFACLFVCVLNQLLNVAHVRICHF